MRFEARDDLGIGFAAAGLEPLRDDVAMGGDHHQHEILVARLEVVDGLARNVGDHHPAGGDIGID